MDILLVTAYYPIKKSKYTTDVYDEWLKTFFQCVSCPVIFFCSSETYLKLYSDANSNVRFEQRDFESWDMMKEPQMSKWKKWHNIDEERNIHSPELYAIWGAKQEFVREAIKIQESKCYIWCDAGLFRKVRDGSFKNTLSFIEPEKITCLNVTNLSAVRVKLIGGGVLAGDKSAWLNFSKNYLEELNINIHGKDQIIYQRILNKSNSILINAEYTYGDPWFYLSSLFSENINFLTVHLMGGLGNQLFQLAFLLYTSKISKKPFFLNTLTSPSAGHSSEQYFESLLQKWKPNFSKKTTITLNENHKLAYEDWEAKINSVNENINLFGYFQRYEYVDLIRDEFISRLTFDETILKKYPNISNKFFIHVRGGDYRGNKFHEINLTHYYKQCMKLHSEEEFVIFTNDIPYARRLFPEIPIITENEINSLFLMSKAKGCICPNSSFSWWGAYLNKNRPIYFPEKWFNDSTMDTSGLYFPEIKTITINDLSLSNKIIPTNYTFLPDKITPVAPVAPTNYNSFVDKIIYINLDERIDRREQIERELKYFSVRRFSAIKNDNGAIGCTMSHIAVLEMAMQEGWNNYLVVEDDMAWKSSDFGRLTELIDYDVILLGGYDVNYDKQTNKLTNAQSTTAYIVNQRYYGTLLRNFREGLFNLRVTGNSKNYAIDRYWKFLQKTDNWYFVDLCYQRESYSDIENRLVNYNVPRTNALNILRRKR